MRTLISLVGSAALALGIMSTGITAASAAVQSGDLHYTADCGVKELRIAKGSYDVSRAGVVKGDQYCEYQFYAKKGQSVSATIVGSSDIYPVLYGTDSPDLSLDPVKLDKTGEHTIRVLQPRNQARESNTPKPYYITVTIK